MLGRAARSCSPRRLAGLARTGVATAELGPPKLLHRGEEGAEHAELEALLGGLPEYLRGPVQEVLNLEWRQVDFRAGIVRLDPGTTKNKEGRVFPINALPPLGDLLRAQREHVSALERKKGQIISFVFPGRGAARIQSFRKTWKSACKAACLVGKIPHDFRRTAVRNLERAGVPRSVAMQLVGHKSEAIYRRYAIVAEKDLAEGVAKLARLHEQAQGSTERVVVPLATRAQAALAKNR